MSKCWLGGATRVTEFRLALPQDLQFVKSTDLTMPLSNDLTPYKVLAICECSLLIPSLPQEVQYHPLCKRHITTPRYFDDPLRKRESCSNFLKQEKNTNCGRS